MTQTKLKKAVVCATTRSVVNRIALAAIAIMSLSPFFLAEAQQKPNFISGHSAIRIPIEVDNNIVVINASLNGKAPVRMILDTGASATIVNADRAEELGLNGTIDASGSATGGKIEGKMATGISIKVGGVELSNQPVAIIAMPRPPGFDFDGIIGFDFIRAFVIQIDYQAKAVSLYDPAFFTYSGKGRVVPLDLKGRKTPLTAASFRFGKRRLVTAKLELDTGADSAFMLNYPFVEKHRLLKTLRDIARDTGQGAGGEQERLLGRAARISFYAFMFRDVPVIFSLQEKGLEKSIPDGIVGGEVLRRFKLIIDYSRNRMILEPNKSLKEPFDTEDQ